MNFINSIQIGVQRAGRMAIKESPSILAGVAVVGLFTTTFLAIDATPKALRLIDEELNKRMEEANNDHELVVPMTKMDAVKVAWKCYIPTAVVGLTTAACIIGSNSIHLKRAAALASAYSLAETTLREYQDKVVEQIGKNKEEKVRDAIAQDRLDRDPIDGKEVTITGHGEALFYEPLSGRYFRSDIETVRKAVNNYNEELLNDMRKPLNELYYDLDLPNTLLGAELGWDLDDGIIEVRFSSRITPEGLPCIVFDFKKLPHKID